MESNNDEKRQKIKRGITLGTRVLAAKHVVGMIDDNDYCKENSGKLGCTLAKLGLGVAITESLAAVMGFGVDAFFIAKDFFEGKYSKKSEIEEVEVVEQTEESTEK